MHVFPSWNFVSFVVPGFVEQDLPVVCRVLALLFVRPIPLSVGEHGNSHGHKHRRNDQNQNPSAQALNETVPSAGSLGVAKSAALRMSGI
jgi:hypothetical protein